MKVIVQFFAAARDRAGAESIEIEVQAGATVGTLRAAIVEACPALADIAAHLHIAIGDSYATDDVIVTGTQRVACFPPVSGG